MDNYSISEIHALAMERCIETLTVELDNNRSLDLISKPNDIFRPYATLY